MNEAPSAVQSAAQTGQPGKAAGIGWEVGVPRSSQETPVMGVERRGDTCLGVRRGRDRRPRQGIRLYGAKPPTLAKPIAGNWGGATGLGKPDTGNPSVRFDEGPESDGHWLRLSTRRLRPTLLTELGSRPTSVAMTRNRSLTALLMVEVSHRPWRVASPSSR